MGGAVRIHLAATIVVSCFITLAFSSSAGEPKRSANGNAYPYGTTTCLQGDKGPGVQLFLKPYRRCEGKVSQPHLEVDIREQPILAHKSIIIGAENWAFRCLNPNESCQQASSGNVVFDHLDDTSGEGIETDGYYELRFSSGRSESGLFKVDCTAPCA
jgi:hypothetical protein